MSKKKLQVEGIMNELEGASLFFSKSPTPPQPQAESKKNIKPKLNQETPVTKPAEQNVSNLTVSLDNRPNYLINKLKNIKSIKHASKLASTPASTPAIQPYDSLEAIRKKVKQLGKDVVFIRITPEEKHELGSIVYSFSELYREEGRKTSENEVARIALNFLMQDYRENGNNSILAKVLAALNA